MAYAFMRTMVQTRSKGHTATGAVCYRMGLASASTIPGADGLERRFDYTRRTGILATGHAAPPGTDPSWGDPITWAHRIEAVDKRKNSRQCRDDVVGIPVELVEAGVADEAIQAYADRLAEEHKTVVHFALHRPDRGGKNHHAHVLYPGRHVAGMTFAQKRDRTQDNPGKGGDPELISQHKGFWSEICRSRGIELDWTSEAPGHHLGPALCAVKRARLVEETRERIRETVAASKPGEPARGERTLQAVAEIATRVNDGLTVTEMLERERQEILHGRTAPQRVPAPAPFQPEFLPAVKSAPEFLPAVKSAPEFLPAVKSAPEFLPAVKSAPEFLPAVKSAPEFLPAVKSAPEFLPAVKSAPEFLPAVKSAPEFLPAVHRKAEVLPPREVATAIIAARAEEEHPRETAETWSAVENLLEQQRQQTQAHESARAAAEKLGDRARKRERSKPLPQQPSRIQRLAGWLLNCAHQVLERLGLKPQQVLEEQEESPERVAAMEKELRSRAKWYHDKDSVSWVLHSATHDITGESRRDWKTTSLEEQTRILDKADLLCMSGWMVGRAQTMSPVTPAQETIRAAAQEIAGDPKLNDWQRTLAAGLASGQVRTHLDRHASVADEEQDTTDHLMEAKRKDAAEEAHQQTAAAFKKWNATPKWRRGRKPEPVRAAEPDPPTPDEIRDFRQEVFRTIKEAMQKVLEKFSEPIRDVVDRAFDRGELPAPRPSIISSEPRTKTRGHDPGRSM